VPQVTTPQGVRPSQANFERDDVGGTNLPNDLEVMNQAREEPYLICVPNRRREESTPAGESETTFDWC